MLLDFLLWTLLLYWIHRLIHVIPFVKKIHLSHHIYISTHSVSWKWNNLLLFNDNIASTVDLWVTEVLPTIILCIIIKSWWILIFYYIWAALVQERIEHNPLINFPILTSGQWHLVHHKSPFNYGLLLPIWDIVFGTYKKI